MRLEEAGLTILDQLDYERLKEKVAELERKNKLLRDLALGTQEQETVAELVLREAMTR